MANISEDDLKVINKILTDLLASLTLTGEISASSDVVKINCTGPGFGNSERIHGDLRFALLMGADTVAAVYAPLKIEVKLPGEDKPRTYAYAK